ncbi:MAG: 50S ribosomal protein L18 [Saprospiraceae bacterium]|nr:MAG: 50S ribosomal protein L18 [Saprospiraceae bacterium]
MQFNKEKRRKNIHYRIRRRLKGTAERPRLAIYRSNRDIYCQVIDDVAGHTIAAVSTRDKGAEKTGNKTEQAKVIGKLLGERLKSLNIDRVVFDRGGYLYHGRVKALADGAREAGLNF